MSRIRNGARLLESQPRPIPLFEPGRRLSSHPAHQRLAFRHRNCSRSCHPAFFAASTEKISRHLYGRPVGAEHRRKEELRNVSPLRSIPMCASFSRSEYYDRTDAHDRLGGVLTLAFCRKPPTFTKTDSTLAIVRSFHLRASWRIQRPIVFNVGAGLCVCNGKMRRTPSHDETHALVADTQACPYVVAAMAIQKQRQALCREVRPTIC